MLKNIAGLGLTPSMTYTEFAKQEERYQQAIVKIVQQREACGTNISAKKMEFSYLFELGTRMCLYKLLVEYKREEKARVQLIKYSDTLLSLEPTDEQPRLKKIKEEWEKHLQGNASSST